jgi:F420-dependent methylenetetrahydromethanopterin dehydrogenase
MGSCALLCGWRTCSIELEKAGDSVSRKPHARSGELMKKTGLLDKPERDLRITFAPLVDHH